MAFCAIFVPDFLLQAVQRLEPALRDQPLALLDGPAPTFQVIALNQQARSLGLTPGLTKAAASEFAGVQLRFRAKDQEAAAHAALLDAAWSFSPRVENTALDILLLDLQGLTGLLGSYDKIGLQIQSRCRELGLRVHVAISENIETARALACACPGPAIVPAGRESEFLKPLPVELLAPSAELSEVLRHWGIATCGALAALPVLSLSECVGQEGVRLHAIACGKSHRALVLAQPALMFEESLELEDAVEELEPLSFLLGRLLDQLCARVSARALAIRIILLQFELQPAFEDAFDVSREALRGKQLSGTFSCSLHLPRPVQDSKLLLKLLRLRLQDRPPHAPVQKIRMSAEPDRPLAVQGGLFLPAAPDPDKLELTLARLAAIVGETNVGSARLLDSHRPDAFRMQKFAAASVPASSEPSLHPLAENPKLAFRFFRPPLPAYVSLRQSRPAKVAWKGKTGKVIQASGPWRLSGHWWEESSWQEEAWEVEVHFSGESLPSSGVFCIVFDSARKQWFVRGSCD